MEYNNTDALKAREDPDFRNRFISDNKKFILSAAYKCVGHFVTESDDEWSIALIAFNEAIESYEEGKGNFYSFASLVIKRRLVDDIRKQARHSSEIPVDRTAIDGDMDDESPAAPINLEVRKKEASMSADGSDYPSGSVTIKDEIEALGQVLAAYGFSFFDLAECSPKAAKTRSSCAMAVRCLLREESLLKKMRQSHTLPISEIQKKEDLPRKILERHRKYIIAAGEILGGDYPLLSEYMHFIKESSGGIDSGISPMVTAILMLFAPMIP